MVGQKINVSGLSWMLLVLLGLSMVHMGSAFDEAEDALRIFNELRRAGRPYTASMGPSRSTTGPSTSTTGPSTSSTGPSTTTTGPLTTTTRPSKFIRQNKTACTALDEALEHSVADIVEAQVQIDGVFQRYAGWSRQAMSRVLSSGTIRDFLAAVLALRAELGPIVSDTFELIDVVSDVIAYADLDLDFAVSRRRFRTNWKDYNPYKNLSKYENVAQAQSTETSVKLTRYQNIMAYALKHSSTIVERTGEFPKYQGNPERAQRWLSGAREIFYAMSVKLSDRCFIILNLIKNDFSEYTADVDALYRKLAK